jgi:glycosyltransferase involved in cell wall biosynthesis
MSEAGVGARPGAWLPERPAVFASSFHPHAGGVEELVRQLCHRQTLAGARPVIHTMRWPRALPARERWEGLDIRRHSYRIPEGPARKVMTASLGNPVVLADVVRQLRADRADVVHVQCVNLGAWFAFHAARVLRLPFVMTLQGELTMDAADVYGRSHRMRQMLRMLLRRADAVTACSHATLTEAESWAGIQLGARGRVVYNGVDTREFATTGEPRSAGKPFVLAIGRHVIQKGFDVLIDAFGKLVADAAFDWDLVIAGDGPLRDALAAQATHAGLETRVRLVGRTDRPATVALFRDAAAFVLPSRLEPFGIVNLEAMAAGTPVVASRVGGVPEFVEDGVSGLLVEPGDAGALADAIRRLWASRALRADLAKRGAQQSQRFDWVGIEQQYREVYGTARAARSTR